MASPKISIITPSFNRAYIISETAQSIFNQSYTNWEWVIVDDGSTDNSWDILQDYAAKDNRVKVFQRGREPKGACTCRNIAVESCTGEYLLFLDTDDLLAPFCLEQRINAMSEESENDMVIFPMLLFKQKTDDLNLLWNIDTDEDDLLRVLAGDPICQGTGTLWKKESFVKIGMWKEDLKLWQDVDLHIRSFLWPVTYSKRMDFKPDVYLRISEDSLSRGEYYSTPKMQSRISVFISASTDIIQKGLLQKYITGLQVMSIDVIRSAIKSRYDKGAWEVFQYCIQNRILTFKQSIILGIYILVYKLKLYKVPGIVKWLDGLETLNRSKVNLNNIIWESN